MTMDDLMRWFAVKKTGVCMERSPLAGFSGYTRHVTIMPDARVIVEFLWADSDEGGPTYTAGSGSLPDAVHAIEIFTGRKIAEWENLTASGWYPEAETSPERDSAAFKRAVREGQFPLPSSMTFTLKERYWREV